MKARFLNFVDNKPVKLTPMQAKTAGFDVCNIDSDDDEAIVLTKVATFLGKEESDLEITWEKKYKNWSLRPNQYDEI